MAKTDPTIHIHHGAVMGRLKASSRPVTTALQSLTVMGFFISFWITASVTTQLATQIATIRKVLMPNTYPATARAGKSATITLCIILEVLCFARICGDEDTVSVKSNLLN